MRAIIPVAGVGSRLKPHTHTVPKVLLNVGGKPILGHIIEKLVAEGIFKATFIFGHLGEMIKNYVETNFPSLEADFVQQTNPEGLGHAIFTALPTFDEKEIFIILGDTIFDVELKSVFEKKISSLGVKKVDDPSRFGVAFIKEDGFISELIEKPETPVSNLALVGLYYITEPDVLKQCLTTIVEQNIRTRGELQLTDALQMMIKKGTKISTFNVDGWYDCGKPETLLATNQFLLKSKPNHIEFPTVTVIPPVYIDATAQIENSIIGPFATIGAGAKISEAIIKNSIIGNNGEVKRALLENSIIGNNSIIKGSYKRLNTGDSSEIDFY